MLAAPAFVVTCGDLGDIYGRRRVFVYGIAVYALASLVIAASTGPPMLIAGRALQGLGSAVIVPVSLSIIGVRFAPERRAGAIGIWAAIVGLGFALGPLIRGFLTDALSWQWIAAALSGRLSQNTDPRRGTPARAGRRAVALTSPVR